MTQNIEKTNYIKFTYSDYKQSLFKLERAYSNIRKIENSNSNLNITKFKKLIDEDIILKDISGLIIKIPPTNKNTIVSIIPEFKYLFNLFNIFYLFLFYLNKFLILVHRFVLDDSSVMFVFSSCFSLPSNTIINLVSSFMLVLFDAYEV